MATPEVWRLLDLSAPEDPVWNMALDTALLDAPAQGAPTLRFYRWAHPALSIGYFQSVEKTVRSFDCPAQDLWVVRRPTGGGLVRHGTDLTMSFSVSENHPRLAGGVSASYRAVHTLLREALLPVFPRLAFSARVTSLKPRSERSCFEEPVACDLEWRGAKVVGSSQRRKNGRLLHQTSMQLAGDTADMARRIAAVFEKNWNIRLSPDRICASERSIAQALRDTAAASAEWAFIPSSRLSGKSPIFS